MVKKDKVKKAKDETAKVEPKVKCTDKACPFHGSTKLHGRTFKGLVISAKAPKTVTVVRERRYYLRKYERYEKRRTKLLVHNPGCINAKPGDEVIIKETRPLSKTKHFVVVEVVK